MRDHDFHTHTTYADGKHTVKEMADAAFALGMKTLGFSEHAYVAFDPSCGLLPEMAAAYRADVAAVRQEYQGRMSVFCGIEADYYSQEDLSGYDYRIGSVHYLKLGNEYGAVDLSAKETHRLICDYFNGDPYRYASSYYETLATLFSRVDADIIGHFDLITKFSEKEPLLDTSDPRYVTVWQEAVEALLPYGKPFEINTGAISRGYRTAPYPSADILRYLAKRGAKILLSSDSHRKDSLCFAFEQAKQIALACGFASRCILSETGWQEIEL